MPGQGRLLSDHRHAQVAQVASHIARTESAPCPCHEHADVFRGHGPANGAARHVGAKLVDVARRAEVSAATVSNVLNRPDKVAERTRTRVETAIAELGYVRAGQSAETAAH